MKQNKLQMNKFKSTFASTISIKMIMTRTNEFSFHNLSPLVLLESVQKHRRGNVIFKRVADWQRTRYVARGYPDIPICNSLQRNSSIDCLNSPKLMMIILSAYFIVLYFYNLCFLLNSRKSDKMVKSTVCHWCYQ